MGEPLMTGAAWALEDEPPEEEPEELEELEALVGEVSEELSPQQPASSAAAIAQTPGINSRCIILDRPHAVASGSGNPKNEGDFTTAHFDMATGNPAI
jgi:hypothetical protein